MKLNEGKTNMIELRMKPTKMGTFASHITLYNVITTGTENVEKYLVFFTLKTETLFICWTSKYSRISLWKV